MRVITSGPTLTLLADGADDERALTTVAEEWVAVGYILLRRTPDGHADALDARQMTYRARYDNHEDPLVPKTRPHPLSDRMIHGR